LPIFSVFSGYTIYYFLNNKWTIKFLKNLTILVIACGLLFSLLSFVTRMNQFGPNQDFLDAMDFLSAREKGNVLTHYSYGFRLNHLSGHYPILTINMPMTLNPSDRFTDVNSLFSIRNLKEAQYLLQKYNIKYILITPEMKEGLVWSNENEGLLFLFRNKDEFKNIYNHDIDIWEVHG